MEDVAAPELPHLLALPQRGEAHHAVGATGGGAARAGGDPVLVEVVGEGDEAGEAGADEGGVDGVGGVGGGAVGGSGEAEGVEEGVEEGEEEGAEVVDAAGDDGEEEEGDGVGGDVVELALQHRRFDDFDCVPAGWRKERRRWRGLGLVVVVVVEWRAKTQKSGRWSCAVL